MRLHPGRFRATILGLALATLLPAFAAGDTIRSNAVICTSAIQHPVSVTVQALDPIRRGASVRLVVHASSRVGLGRAEVRVVNAGRASLAGPSRVALGRLEARRVKDTTFRFVVPSTGERTLIQFTVTGEGPNGVLSRGAAFNVLPDGPTEVLTPVATASGERLLSAPARRIDR